MLVEEGVVRVVLHRVSKGAVLLDVGADSRGTLRRLVEMSTLPAMTRHVKVPIIIVPGDLAGVADWLQRGAGLDWVSSRASGTTGPQAAASGADPNPHTGGRRA